MFCEPAMAEATHSLRINAAYLWPMRSLLSTPSFGGNQLPRLPITKGKTSTFWKRFSRVCRRGSYLLIFSAAASWRASGLPSNGTQTSTRMAELPSVEIIVRSGLLAPVVPGSGCSLNLFPIDGGMARISLSRTALCRSRIIPMLGRQWLVRWDSVSGTR